MHTHSTHPCMLMDAQGMLIHLHSHSRHTQRNITNVVIVFRSTLKYLLLFVHPKFHSSMKLHSMHHVYYGAYFCENNNNVYNSYQWISTWKNWSPTTMILLKSSSVFFSDIVLYIYMNILKHLMVVGVCMTNSHIQGIDRSDWRDSEMSKYESWLE